MKQLLYLAGCICIFLSGFHPVSAQTADNGDGTFTNPVLWADFPDPDVIRVDNKYYMVSTSMFYFPGVTVMESSDLVNWKIAANAIENFDAHPAYNMDGGHRYGKGQWATSIRYFNNQFYLLFTTLNEGSFMCTAPKASGPWTVHKLDAFLYDPGLFVDTDGRVYVIHGNTEIQLTEMTADGLRVKVKEKLIYKAHRRGLEGNHCYKIGDYYYIFCTYGGPQGNQVCLRSKSLTGPFEERVMLNDHTNYAPLVLHQGCLIDLPDGSYWSIIFQDHGGLGRIPYLLPVTWTAGWLLLGNPMDGNITLKKPIDSKEIAVFPTTDEFDLPALAAQWQFNHNPDKDKYSLTERKGWLRLHTATVTDSIMQARNTVCQRIFGPHSQATAKIDISKMQAGDKAGLMLLQDPNASLTIYKSKKGAELQMTVSDLVVSSQALESSIVYLRAEVSGISDKANFFYSLDDKQYHPIGKEFKMEYKLTVFCGNRYGLFSYATQKLGGLIDVDWFRVVHQPLFDRNNIAGKEMEAEYFDHQYLSETRLSKQDMDNRNQDVVFEDGGLIAFNNLSISKTGLQNLEVTAECSSPRATLEVWNRTTGTLLGKLPLPLTDGQYKALSIGLSTPATAIERLEFIVRKPNRTGVVALDKFRFVEVQTAAFEYFRYKGNDARFDKQIDPKNQYFNPILAGFYPDPSICRKGDTYYLINSSFSFYPGVPIFTSKDLVNWEQIGNVLDRPSQLNLTDQDVSAGVFAPAIEYNPYNETFYMITTGVYGLGNFFVKTKDPAKGWSDPVRLPEINGIDPSFFFDEDGKGYIVHNAEPERKADWNQQRAIRMYEFDVKTEKVIGSGKEVIRGGARPEDKPIWIEGPHLYKIDGYYYLMCAEGGTGDWHSEVIFRSKDAWGDYEPYKNNPILTQRDLPNDRNDKITWAGHADMIQTPEGDWWAVFLACRPNADNMTNTGRETFLLPVEWKEGFPTILPQGKSIPIVLDKKGLKPSAHPTSGNFEYINEFDTPVLDYSWMYLRTPAKKFYTTGDGKLTITPLPASIEEKKPQSAVFRRQQHTNFEVETQLQFSPKTETDFAGFTLFQNERFHFVFGKTVVNGVESLVVNRVEKGKTSLASLPLKEDSSSPIMLKVVGKGRYYDFLYSLDGKKWVTVAADADGANLSTQRAGGFIGECIGLYATSANANK
jgi:alpha-N-arabinofuranosidase